MMLTHFHVLVFFPHIFFDVSIQIASPFLLSCLDCFYIFWIQPIHQICDLQILSPSLWLSFSFSWKSFLEQEFLILKKPKLSIFSCIDHILCHIWEYFAEFNVTKLSPVFFSQTSLSNMSMIATNSMWLCCCSVTKSCHADEEAAVRTGHGATDWFQIRKGVC